MQINIYNFEGSKINLIKESFYVHPNILIADKLLLDSLTAVFIIIQFDIPSYKDETVIKVYANNIEKNEANAKWESTIRKNLPIVKRLKQSKNKTKKEFEQIAKFKYVIDWCKTQMLIHNEKTLNALDIFELLTFVKDALIKVNIENMHGDKSKEDGYIQQIVSTLTEGKNILLLDDILEEFFSFTKLSTTQNEIKDFIKIPLCDFPLFRGVKYEEMLYTREDLKPVFAPFKEDLKKLSEQLAELSYNSGNFEQINHLCQQAIVPHIAQIQQSVEESIYLSKFRNLYSDKIKIKCCLGITSAETLADYYHKAEVLVPYVVNEIKEQLNRHSILNKCYVFMYYEIQGTEEIYKILKVAVPDLKIFNV
ncbi:MAG: hypothetical protein WCH34_11135 [Bacteroidota bacterium]